MNNFKTIINNYFEEDLVDIEKIEYSKSNRQLDLVLAVHAFYFSDKFDQLKKQIKKDLFFLNEINIK